LPEDLIFRFAQKLEFGTLTNKVAEDAVRMVQRMSLDWMVMGRRPSGVCGACLILAARMNNFRRTITEVVYIVKVTTHTIQKRLDEFKVTPSSALTVEEFLNNEFLESSHDPPSFYEKSEEWQKNKKKRKRRNKGQNDEDEENSGSEAGSDEANKRQRTAEATDQPVQSVELRRDADGFAIPPQPTQSHDIPIDPDLIDDAIQDQSGTSFDKLVAQFGDTVNEPDADNDDASSTGSASTPRRRGRPRDRPVNVPAEWASIEEELESEMSEMISDPNTIHHAASYAQAKRRAAAHMLVAERTNPSKNVNMDVHIGEDEFADDPEVLNCQLAPEEVEKKEKLWVNANKDWLRKQQIKMWQKKAAENGPPKARRNRKKKPRIGEGQLTAASSPAEAAINVMKERAFSKKINYQAIADIFEGIERLGERLGSAGTSRITSRAGSEFNDSVAGSSRASSIAPSAAGSVDGDRGSRMGTPSAASPSHRPTSVGLIRGPKERTSRTPRFTRTPAAAIASTSTAPIPLLADDEEGDDDDYVSPSRTLAQEEPEDWRSQIRKQSHTEGGEEFEEDEEDYDDYGDIEPGGIADDAFDKAFGDGDEDLDEDAGYGEDD
jgi:transcription factor IIIB subunit 2